MYFSRASLIASGLSVAALLAVAACSSREKTATHDMTPVPVATRAIAVLSPTQGSVVYGTVTFAQESGGVRVTADIHGLTPGKHGFHIHEFGDCSAPDATSAGGHFAPGGMPHGSPSDHQRHEGDLGNIVADSNGVAAYDWLDPQLTFSGPASILGRGVIVHADEDDLVSQPTGAAGARVACGVIGVAK